MLGEIQTGRAARLGEGVVQALQILADNAAGEAPGVGVPRPTSVERPASPDRAVQEPRQLLHLGAHGHPVSGGPDGGVDDAARRQGRIV